MIIVGIDFGDARTGIAVCDKYEMMATEAGCVHADSYKKALAAVGEKVVELKAELIVVGNPINMDGSQGSRSEKCKAFARELVGAYRNSHRDVRREAHHSLRAQDTERQQRQGQKTQGNRRRPLRKAHT